MLNIYTFGTFSVNDANGVGFTPKGKKARALIALLALSPDYKRPRHWLRDKLWSDRGEEQADASLRQTLSEIRRSFAEYSDILIASSNNVALDRDYVEIHFKPHKDQTNGAAGVLLFEDLNIRDQGFKDWLTLQRDVFSLQKGNQQPIPLQKRTRPLILIDHRGGTSEKEIWFYDAFCQQIANSVLDYSDAKIIDCSKLEDTKLPTSYSPTLAVSCSIIKENKNWNLSVRLEYFTTSELIWSSTRTAICDEITPIGTDIVNQFISEIVAEIIDALTQLAERTMDTRLPLALANRARSNIFLMDKNKLSEADQLLKLAYELEPNGQYLAWRAFLRSTALFEFQNTDFLADHHTRTELMGHAQEASPCNSQVLAIAGQTNMLKTGEAKASLTFGKKSIEKNPINSLAWAFVSNACLYVGKYNEAYSSSKHGLNLVANRAESHFWDFSCCMSASALGKYDEAIVHAENALVFAPKFKAPLRYLYALYSATNRSSDIARINKKLIAIEPDFGPEKFFQDNYPVNTMRKLPLIDRIKM